MKKMFAAFALMTAVAITPMFAGARATMRAEIPFDFQVGKAVLPAGTYEVLEDVETIQIRNMDGKGSAYALTLGAPQAAAGDASLAFNVNDGKYTLASVSRGNDTRELTNSRATRGETIAFVKAALYQ